MPAIYVSRLSQWVEKHFNAKGGNVITDVDNTAHVELAFPIGVEDRYLQGWNRFGWVIPVTAVAAQFSRVRIRNPVGSNVMIVMEMITAVSVTTDQSNIQWGAVTVDLATVVTTTFARIDPRGNTNSTAILSSTTQAAAGQANIQKSGVQGNMEFIQSVNQEIPILPGNGLDLTSQTLNQGMNVSLMWRERALELSELT